MEFTEISKKIALFTLVISTLIFLYMLNQYKLSLMSFQILSVVIGSSSYLALSINSKILKTKKVAISKILFLLLLSIILFLVFMTNILTQDNTNRGAVTLLMFSIVISLLVFYGTVSYTITFIHVFLAIILLTSFISTFYVGDIIQYQDDPGAYLVMTKSLVTHGKVVSIPLWSHHYGIPYYNIWQAMLLLIPEIHEANLQLISTVVLSFNFLLLSYIMFKKMFNQNIAYIAMILSLVFPVTLKWTYVQDSRAFAMIFILLGLISYLSFERSSAYLIVLIISWFSILNSHYFYSLIFVILIFVPMIILMAIPPIDRKGQYIRVRSRWIVILAVVSYLSKVSMYQDIFLPFVWGFYRLVHDGSLKNLAITSTTQLALGEFLMYLPFLIYIILSVAGAFMYVENFDMKSTKDIQIMLSLISISVMSVPIIKMGMYILNPRRIFYFLGLVFGLLSSITIWEISKRTISKKLGSVFIFIILLLLCFLSISSNLSNQLDPVFYNGKYPVLYYHTLSEKYSILGISNWISREASICSDYKTTSRYIVPMWIYKNRKIIKNISDLDICQDYVIFSYIAINRSFLVSPNNQYAEGTISLSVLKNQIARSLVYKNKIYDGVVIVYASGG